MKIALLRFSRGCFALLFGLFLAGGAGAVKVEGQEFDGEIVVRGNRLVLNGTAVREASGLFKTQKVAAIGLYLPKRAQSYAAVMEQPGYKRYRVVFLHEVPGEKLGKGLSANIEKSSSRAEFVQLIPALTRIGQAFAKKKTFAVGDSYTLEWVPSDGTYLYFNDKLADPEPIREKEFFEMVIRNAIGNHAKDEEIKRGLLGMPGATSTQR